MVLITNKPITLNPTGWIAGDWLDLPNDKKAIVSPEGADTKIEVQGDGSYRLIPKTLPSVASEFLVRGNELVVQVVGVAWHVIRFIDCE